MNKFHRLVFQFNSFTDGIAERSALTVNFYLLISLNPFLGLRIK